MDRGGGAEKGWGKGREEGVVEKWVAKELKMGGECGANCGSTILFEIIAF